jgi:GNAT superfamily N-acetyltransferase
VRYCPGKAQRARCIQPVGAGSGPLDHRLARCLRLYQHARLPAIMRLTPFSQPPGLDAELAALGWRRYDDTVVMWRDSVPLAAPPLPDGTLLTPADAAELAEVVGSLRGTPPAERVSQAARLAAAPVPHRGWVLRASADGAVLACGQTATEDGLVGLYDVFTAPAARGRGLAGWLCAAMLAAAARDDGAVSAYLQVGAENAAARRVYQRLGFADCYGYHYRTPTG